MFFAVYDLERSCGCFSLLAISGSYLFEFASLLLSLYASIPAFDVFFSSVAAFIERDFISNECELFPVVSLYTIHHFPLPNNSYEFCGCF